jgi:pimeloyl-ACP methyl ester carboxylesterase
MATTTVDGLTLGYELIGTSGQPWVITPGGRFTKESPGVRALAEAIAAQGNRVLIWDRPNCGESSVSFEGPTESDMQADALAGLLRQLELDPAVIVGGSGGSRVSLLTVANHPDVAAALAVVWISGGVFGLMSLGVHYCAPSIHAAWTDSMEAVADLPDWAEVIEGNPSNRQRIIETDRDAFLMTLQRWMAAYYPRPGEHVPGLPETLARTITTPTLVFRSGVSDPYHTRETSEALAEMIPNAQLVEPPWPDTEWNDGGRRRAEGTQTDPFDSWPQLAPQLLTWAGEVLD